MVNFIQFISGLTNEVEIFDLEELESFWNDFSLQFEDMKPDERNTKSQEFSPLIVELIKSAVRRMPLGEKQYEFVETIDDEKDPRFTDEFEQKNKY